MTWTVTFYSDRVEAEILALPIGYLARFILLHPFVKKTDRTPSKELDIARRRLKEVKHG